MSKPRIDPVTGCAHIENEHTPLGWFRVCSACKACVPIAVHHMGAVLEEANINYCYNCGETFDHTDDDPPPEDENK